MKGLFLPVLLIGLTCSTTGYGQEKDWRLYQPSDRKADTLTSMRPRVERDSVKKGEVNYHVSEDILTLDSLRREYPTKNMGYRVQIYFGSREDAQEMRTKFIQEHPETGAYISYLAPNFRLRVGDFRSRIECESFKQKIAREYPGSYLVKDKIELPPLYSEAERDGSN